MVKSLILCGIAWVCIAATVFSQTVSFPTDSLLTDAGANQAGIHATNGSAKGKDALWTDMQLPSTPLMSKNLNQLPRSFRLLQLDAEAMEENFKK